MSPETPNVPSPASNSETLTCGRVKWFNNKAGYGFITVSDGDHAGEDVIAHHSAITVKEEQYRYLIQGEYVEFNLCEVNDNNHKWQAGNVHGINGGKLMCETRLETRENRSRKPSETDDRRQVTRMQPREDVSHHRVRTRGPGPREGDEWMLVRRRANTPRHGAQSPVRETLRTRQTKAPYKDGD